jgi:hypothetical protein
MGSYLNLKKKHQDELDEFPMVFAFNEKQFDEAMGKLGLTANDTDKIYSIGGGGFIRKIDSDKLSEMFERHSKEMEEGMKDPQFVYEAFSYELSNHEFIVTGDSTDALESLGITPEEVGKNQMWLGQLKKAVAEQYKYYENRN